MQVSCFWVVMTVTLARLDMLKLLDAIDDLERPNLGAYYSRMKARPSFEAAMVWNRIRIGPILRVVGPHIFGRLLALSVLLALSAWLVGWLMG